MYGVTAVRFEVIQTISLRGASLQCNMYCCGLKYGAGMIKGNGKQIELENMSNSVESQYREIDRPRFKTKRVYKALRRKKCFGHWSSTLI
jgi:hypothetical protein